MPEGMLEQRPSFFRRFRANRLAFASLIFIAVSVLAAILVYLITPDPTPMANKQLLEISRKKPGFSVMMLRIQKQSHPG